MKIYEYSLTTCEMGVMYAKGLDPHGDNVAYAYGDANHRLPRSQESNCDDELRSIISCV